MSSLTQLKIKRGQVKGTLTRFQKYLQSVQGGDLDENIFIQLKLRLDRVEPLFNEFSDIQSEIECLLENTEGTDQKEKEITERDNFETLYFNLVSKVSNIIIKYEEQNQNCNARDNDNFHHKSVDSQCTPSVKLPELKLPIFKGSFDKWLEFSEAFTSLIDKNTTLDKVQKFYYLRSSLEGEAAQVLESIQVTEGNYDLAWSILKERYENKKLIIHNYVKSLFEAPVLTKESYFELRKLYDHFNKNIRSLKILGQPTDQWDTLLIYLLSGKFDSRTRRDWEAFQISTNLPTMTDMEGFLKGKCELLENLTNSRTEQVKLGHQNGKPRWQTQSYFSGSENSRPESSVANLATPPLPASVAVLQGQGNSKVGSPSDDKKGAKTVVSTQNSVVAHTTNRTTQNYAILSTAVVNVKNKFGKNVRARILLDPGSQSNFVTESFCNKVGVNKIPVNFEVSGVGNNGSLPAHFKTNLKIFSHFNDFSKEISCLILPNITQAIPICDFDSSFLNIPGDIKMADPNFNIKGDIDILCGVGVFYEIILMNQIKLDKSLTLLNTKLGWVLGGEISHVFLTNKQIISCHAIDESLNDSLIKFWQIEECSNVIKRDDFCEAHFKETFRRDDTGRFIVKIPFKGNLSELGSSKEMALRRFKLLEKRLAKNDDFRHQYVDFINEYLSLDHMTEITDTIDDESDGNAGGAYYLPHHAVVKDSLTTRLRVVFDASAKSDSGLSLNDMQYTGPTVQNDLFTILLNFRKHLYVISADISKMYRQVLVDNDQRRFQRIFWRNDINENIKCFELNTVTYGMACAPYLAIRCLQQLALESEEKYPVASEVIKNCFYVDDLLAGQDSESEILNLQRDITKILASAGFELRKWLCNKPELCYRFQIIEGLKESILELGENEQNKTLGVHWNASSDVIQYRIRDFDNQIIVSKRLILSIISQIFDPLGLLGPVIMIAKLILQNLWKEKLTWDQEVSKILRDKWLHFCSDLRNLKNISVPRHVFSDKPEFIELHLFADASEKGYGACAYIRCKNGDDFSCNLLCAKSKVAPIKRVTLPRLELCAAVLAVNLAIKIKDSLNVNFVRIFYWSDSTITLHWINGSSDRWKLFVANRVSFIQSSTEINDWFHVKSEHNPADLISRGVSATQLLDSKLWWNGPCWLKLDKSKWELNEFLNNLSLDSIPEQRITCNMTVKIDDFDLFTKISTLSKLKRVVAYCRRFIFNCRNPRPDRISGTLKVSELRESLLTLVKMSQKQSFYQEYSDLKSKDYVKGSSNIIPLHPFLENDIIRVGGRIQKSNISYSQMHPIILHHKHPLTTLIMTNEHKILLHCGPQQLLYSIRMSYWPTSGRSLARQIIHKCITCFKAKPRVSEYLMGNLPTERVNQFIPFVNTSCDYAGPFLLKDRKTRKPCLTKAWVCIFVCMSTKAVHLELVTDLSSSAFLACFKRFVSRRGKPTNIFSDNGTNFVGADSEIKSFFKTHGDSIFSNLANDNITWHYIPARAPNFGGLWEAGVKVLKHHLKRIIGNNNLHYEDFMTILTQIEAIMNSRPLCPLSSSPDDFTPLTPGHFLIGKPLTSVPEPCVVHTPENRLSHYKRLQQMVQQYWARWSVEYISELQTRLKWRENASSLIKVGDLVLVKEDKLPPLKWKLARVQQLHPGDDDIIRVVTIKLSNGTQTRRSLRKLCILPLQN